MPDTIPNAERVIADYLRSWSGIPRVVNKTPDDQTDAWIKLTQLNAPSETEPVDWLIRFMFQVDVYAGKDGGRPEANSLGAAVRAALKEIPGGTDDAVVTGSSCVGDASVPDTSFTPARERKSLTFYFWMHANP